MLPSVLVPEFIFFIIVFKLSVLIDLIDFE